ncbi:MAG: hypothetical protein ACREBQ_14450, partial [Nitrososphaerales archaeon]
TNLSNMSRLEVMPKILVPPKSGPPKDCQGHNPPQLQGSYYEFELSMDEFKFWKELNSVERENCERRPLSDASLRRCMKRCRPILGKPAAGSGSLS